MTAPRIATAAAAAAAALAGCHPYEPAMMTSPIHDLGCIDVAVEGAWPSESTGPVAIITLGNRCEHSVAIDLGALRAAGLEHVDGLDREVALVAYDPDGAIRVREIAARDSGAEWIEFHPTEAIDTIDQLELDLGAIVPGVAPPRKLVVVIDVPRHHPDVVSP